MAKTVDKYIIDVRAIGAKETTDQLKNTGQSSKNLLKTLGGLAAGLVTARVAFNVLNQSIEAAGKFESVEMGFKNLSTASGFSSQTLGKLRTALNGTTSDMDMMAQANNAMLLGIFDSEDEMAKMFDVAQRLAAAVGKDATYGIESLTTGLGRQSKMMLDNLGIMFDLKDAYQDHADVIGKQVSALTEQEKKTAFTNKAIAEANKLADKAGEEQETLGMVLDQQQASWKNLQVEIGQAFTPAVKLASKMMQGFMGFIDAERIKAWGVAISVTAGAFGLYRLNLVRAKIATITFQAVLARTGWGTIIAAIGLLSGVVMDYMGVFEDATDKTEEGQDAIAEYNKQLAEQTALLEGDIAKQEELAKSIKESEESLKKKLDTLNATSESERLSINLGRELTDVEEGYVKSIEHVEEQLKATTLATKVLQDMQGQLLSIRKANITTEQQSIVLAYERSGADKLEVDNLKTKIDTWNELRTILTGHDKLLGLLSEKAEDFSNDDFHTISNASIDAWGKLTGTKRENAEALTELIRETRTYHNLQLKLNDEIAQDPGAFGLLARSEEMQDALNKNIRLRRKSLQLDEDEAFARGNLVDLDDDAILRDLKEIELKRELLAINPALLRFYEEAAANKKYDDWLLRIVENLKKTIELKDIQIKTEGEWASDAIMQTARVISASGKLLGVNKKNQIVAAKMNAIATGVNAFAAAMAAMKSASDTPVIGHILGPIAYASTLATGLAAATQAHLEAGRMASAEQGGFIGGKRHSQGGTIIEAERGEYILSRNAVNSFGLENLNRMNRGGGGNPITVNISGGLISNDFVENELAEAVREGIRRGADFGIS